MKRFRNIGALAPIPVDPIRPASANGSLPLGLTALDLFFTLRLKFEFNSVILKYLNLICLQEAGLPIGGPDFNPYVMLEVHYNNPTIRGGIDACRVEIFK
jgi:hypothetical protein